jgi:hypothetical protein
VNIEAVREHLKSLCVFCLCNDVPVSHFSRLKIDGRGEFEIYACESCTSMPAGRAREMRDIYEPARQVSRLLEESPATNSPSQPARPTSSR